MQLRLKCFEMLCANRDCTSNKMPKHTEICNIFIGGGSVIGIAAGRRIIVCMRSTPLCIRSQRAMVVRRLSVQLPGGQYGLRTDGRMSCCSSQQSATHEGREAIETAHGGRRDNVIVRLCGWVGGWWRSGARHSCLQPPSAASAALFGVSLSLASCSFVVVVVVVFAFSPAVLDSNFIRFDLLCSSCTTNPREVEIIEFEF